MNVVEQALNALNKYNETKELPIVPENSSQTDFGVWQSVFEQIPEVFTDLVLQENKQNSLWHANNYMSESLTEKQKEPIMKLIGISAWWNIKNYKQTSKNHIVYPHITKLSKDIQTIWEDTFDKINKKDAFLESFNDAKEKYNA